MRQLWLWIMGVLLCVNGVVAQTPRLVQVSTLPAADALGVSADGQFVVGGSLVWNLNTEAFYWTPATGERRLARPAGARKAIARAVSLNGQIIVGEAYYDQSPTIRPVVWRAPNYQPQLLPGPASGYDQGAAADVSDDGRIIVGNFVVSGTQKFALWRDGVLDTNMLQFNGLFRAVSRDGVPIGAFSVGGSVRWTPQRGFESLGGFYAASASQGAQQVVGFVSDIGLRAVYWDSCGSIVLDAPNNTSELYAVSNDGRIAAGTARRGVYAIRWKRERGFLDGLEDLNTTFASYLGGNTLTIVFDMSSDGRYLVGRMRNASGTTAFWLDTAGL